MLDLNPIAKSENVYRDCLDKDILDQKLDGIISVKSGQAFTRLNLKKDGSNSNMPVVYLENIEGDVAQFIQQYSTDLFILGYSVAGLFDQASRKSPDAIQTYVDSVWYFGQLSDNIHRGNRGWFETNKVAYMDKDNYIVNLIDEQQKSEVEMYLKMLGYAYFQSGILAYLYGYIEYHGIKCSPDELNKFKDNQKYNYMRYFIEDASARSYPVGSYEAAHSNSSILYSYTPDLIVNPKFTQQEKGITIQQANSLNEKIGEMHKLGEYAAKVSKKLGDNKLPLDQIPGVFEDTETDNIFRTGKTRLVALCIPEAKSLEGKLSNQAIQIVTNIRKDLEEGIKSKQVAVAPQTPAPIPQVQ